MLIIQTFRHFSRKPPMNSLQLYKYLMRQCDKLPSDAQKFYKHTIRQSYRQHINESDSDRINMMINKTLDDVKFIVNKYVNKEKT